MIKIKLALLLILILTAFPVGLSAQSSEEIESQMDLIKLDETMVYGEAYNDEKDIAYGNAIGELLITANELRSEKGLDPLSPSNIKSVVKELQYSKGGRYVVLLYMPISRMMSLSSILQSDLADQGQTQITQQKAVSPEIKKEDRIITDKPTRISPQASSSSLNVSDEILDALCGQDNWVEIKGFLSSFKAKGKISSTGAVTSVSEVPEDACSILIDDMGGILSILSPKNEATRINYRTNQPDTETNYSNCKFIVWYK